MTRANQRIGIHSMRKRTIIRLLASSVHSFMRRLQTNGFETLILN